MNEKKKVLFIVNSNVFSGAESVNFSIIEALKDKYDFYWVSRLGPINDFLNESNIKWIEVEKINKKEIKRVIKEYNPDILHATDYKASVICALTNTKVPIISHLHNNSPWIKTLHPYSFLYLYSARKFKKILTVSDCIEKEYIFSKYIKDKIINISNPVSREKVLSKVTEKDYEKKYDICCVARLTDVKKPFKFLDIIYELKKEKEDLKAVWVGDGELKESFIKKIKELGLEKNIDVAGFQKNPYKIMASSKIFILISEWEGYGLVAFEALTLGLPCVVSNVGGLPEIVDKNCGIVTNSDKDIKRYCIDTLKDNNKQKQESYNAVEKSKKLDNIKKYNETIIQTYESVLK